MDSVTRAQGVTKHHRRGRTHHVVIQLHDEKRGPNAVEFAEREPTARRADAPILFRSRDRAGALDVRKPSSDARPAVDEPGRFRSIRLVDERLRDGARVEVDVQRRSSLM